MKILIADDDPQILRALRHHPLRPRLRRRHRARRRARPSTPPRRRTPTSCCSTSACRDLDGIEVIEALRGWTTVPILVVSGRTDSGDKVEALDAGADDYVTKPFPSTSCSRASAR